MAEGLAVHRWNCQKARVSCPHSRHGCPVTTTREDLGQHVVNCPYLIFSTLMVETNRRLNMLEARTQSTEATPPERITRDLNFLEARVDSIWGLFGPAVEENQRLRSQMARVPSALSQTLGPDRGLPNLQHEASARRANLDSLPAISASRRFHLIGEFFNGSPPNLALTQEERRGLAIYISLRTDGRPDSNTTTGARAGGRAPGQTLRPREQPRTRTTTEIHATSDLIEPSSPHVRAPHAPEPISTIGHLPLNQPRADSQTFGNAERQVRTMARLSRRDQRADEELQSALAAEAANQVESMRREAELMAVVEAQGVEITGHRPSGFMDLEAARRQDAREAGSAIPIPSGVQAIATPGDLTTEYQVGVQSTVPGFDDGSSFQFQVPPGGPSPAPGSNQRSQTAPSRWLTSASARWASQNGIPIETAAITPRIPFGVTPAAARPFIESAAGERISDLWVQPSNPTAEASSTDIDMDSDMEDLADEERRLIAAVPSIPIPRGGESSGPYVQSSIHADLNAGTATETAYSVQTPSPEDWVHLGDHHGTSHTRDSTARGESGQQDASESTRPHSNFEAYQAPVRSNYNGNRVSTGSRSGQPFADLAFSRFGWPGNPAYPSAPDEVDDQLLELRNVVTRLAEGMDTMERQSQAYVCMR